MTEIGWNWARLNREGIALLRETEASLGGDIVLVYAPGEGLPAEASTREGLAPAHLTPAELEALQGVEQKLGVVAVAYTPAN